jgi:hypothetical protein
MVDIPSFPVYDPAGVFVFIFIPGFLLLLVFRTEYNFSLKKEIIKKEVDYLLLSIIFGIVLSALISFLLPIILKSEYLIPFNFSHKYKSLLVGIFSIYVPLGMILFTYLEDKWFHRKTTRKTIETDKGATKNKVFLRRIVGLIAYTVVLLGGIIIILQIFSSYMSTPNSLINPFSDDSNILQYSFLKCNLNISEKNGPVLNNYEFANLEEIIIVNPFDYPITTQVLNNELNPTLLLQINGTTYDNKGNVLVVPSKESVRFFAFLGERGEGSKKMMYIFAKQELIKSYYYYC